MTAPISPGSVFFRPEYHDLIGLIYDAIHNEDGFFPFLQRFIDVFQGHSASFAVYDMKAEAAVGHWTVNIPEEALSFYAEHIAHQDALVNAALAASERGEQRFVASNLDLGDAEPDIRAQTRAGEWLESFGAHEAAGAVAFQSNNYLNFFGFQRAADQPAFDREQLAVFDLFLPHINRAVALYTEMRALSARDISAERLALNSIQNGILICDVSFKVVFSNETALDLIARSPDMRLSEEGLLTFRNKDFGHQVINSLSSAVHASLDSAEKPNSVLRYQGGGKDIMVTITPLASHRSERSRGGAMISLYDWSQPAAVDSNVLQRCFGLTDAEARVSSLLAQGESLNDIAEQICRSRETVKSHLKSVFRKTNTARQGELVALLSVSRSLS